VVLSLVPDRSIYIGYKGAVRGTTGRSFGGGSVFPGNIGSKYTEPPAAAFLAEHLYGAASPLLFFQQLLVAGVWYTGRLRSAMVHGGSLPESATAKRRA